MITIENTNPHRIYARIRDYDETKTYSMTIRQVGKQEEIDIPITLELNVEGKSTTFTADLSAFKQATYIFSITTEDTQYSGTFYLINPTAEDKEIYK